MNTLSIASLITGLAAIGLLTHSAFAQESEQTVGATYIGLAMAVIALAGNVFNAYLAQKAKLTGQAPNETDVKIAQALTDIEARLIRSREKDVQLIDFLYNNAVPEQAKRIVEGSLPLIKVQEVTKQVGVAKEKFDKAVDLLNAVQNGATNTDPKPVEEVRSPV